jgi:hypothetical protein
VFPLAVGALGDPIECSRCNRDRHTCDRKRLRSPMLALITVAVSCKAQGGEWHWKIEWRQSRCDSAPLKHMVAGRADLIFGLIRLYQTRTSLLDILTCPLCNSLDLYNWCHICHRSQGFFHICLSAHYLGAKYTTIRLIYNR